MEKRKICVITGTRAEYGLFYWVLREIQQNDHFNLQLIATGMHLCPEFGLTYKVIEQDGFVINEKVEILLSSDSTLATAKSIGLGVIGMADAISRLEPDLILLLGDRFEILAAAQAALVLRVPVAHIAGGDTTEGAFDESIRHAITKMAHIHFVTNEVSLNRVIQMGENPDLVFNVGNPGLDHITKSTMLDRNELEKSLGISFGKKNLLITFHPVTLDTDSADGQLNELFGALDELAESEPEIKFLFTGSNADPQGRLLTQLIERYASQRNNAEFFTSLGQQRYLSAIKLADAVVGNSSSGLLEVPSFRKPTVNIGNRQKGRLQAGSVINCNPVKDEILQAIRQAFELDCSKIKSPYGDGQSAEKIINSLAQIKDFPALLQKTFFDHPLVPGQ